MDPKMIGLKIKAWREIRRYNEEYMARQLQIGQSTYSELEAGKHKIDIARLDRIAGILKVPVNELLDPMPMVFNIQDNHHNNNVGYTHVDQQHMVPQALMDRLLTAHERLIAIVEKHLGNDGKP